MPDFLIADDEQQIRNMIKQYLSELGHETVSVSNGQEALEKLFNNKYSGLFTDLRMPGLDGIGLLNAINEEQILIPTVVVTAYATVELSAELFKLGIKDLITKPFSPEEIKSAANLMLKYSLDLKESSQIIKGLIEQKAFIAASKLICQLFSYFPSSAIPHFLFGLMKEAKGELSEARKHFLASRDLEPSYEPVQKKIAEIDEKNG